jgi:hypothetical protein
VRAGFAIACVLAAPLAARADVIELMNGVRVVGTVTEATARDIVIKVGESSVRIRQDRVRSITFDDARSADAEKPDAATPDAAKPDAAKPDAAKPDAAKPDAAKPEVVVSSTPVRAPQPLSPPIAKALAALDRLQAVTARSLIPAEYAGRVDEVRRTVEEALAQEPDRGDVRAAMVTALRYHEVAALAGATYEERGDLAAIGREPLVAECRPLRELIAQDAARLRLNPDDPTVIGLFVATEGAPFLRTCAGDKIAEAEGLARVAP